MSKKSQKRAYSGKKGYLHSNLSLSVFLSDRLKDVPFHHRLNYGLAVSLTRIPDCFFRLRSRLLNFVSPFQNNSVHIHIIYLGSCYSLSSGESTRNSLEGLITTIKCILHYLQRADMSFS
jgi:hypothetical protein